MEEASGIETTLTAAQWDRANKDHYTLFCLILRKAGVAPAGLICKFKLWVLTGGDGERA